MDPEEFRRHGKEMVDFVADFWSKLRDERTPLPDVKPGYISDVVPPHPPAHPEGWDAIFGDLEDVVMRGNTYWHHPKFFAYFSTACSYQAIVADILSGGISGVGFTWKSCPSMTELEMVMLDWLVEILDLPEWFKNSHEGPGCGIIQSTASDSTMIAILSARARAVDTIKQAESSSSVLSWITKSEVGKTVKNILTRVRQNTVEEETGAPSINQYHDPSVFEKFVAYCSDQAHSSVEKGVILCGVRLRKLKSTLDTQLGNYTVTRETLEAAIKEDRSRGLIPFVLVATLGTTSSCGMDHLDELGPVCQAEHIWMHVDAAYAGSFLVCPEFRYLSKGVEYADSFNYNAHKAMMVNFDCSPMWFKDGTTASKYFNVDPVYLKHEHQAVASDYRHLQVALGRRFRSLKIWFVIRAMGVERIQEWLRQQNSQAAIFAELIDKSSVFEQFTPQHLGLVCFRIKNGTNELNEKLCNAINDDHRIHLVPSKVHGHFFLRFAICSQLTRDDDVREAYQVIEEVYSKMIKN